MDPSAGSTQMAGRSAHGAGTHRAASQGPGSARASLAAASTPPQLVASGALHAAASSTPATYAVTPQLSSGAAPSQAVVALPDNVQVLGPHIQILQPTPGHTASGVDPNATTAALAAAAAASGAHTAHSAGVADGAHLNGGIPLTMAAHGADLAPRASMALQAGGTAAGGHGADIISTVLARYRASRAGGTQSNHEAAENAAAAAAAAASAAGQQARAGRHVPLASSAAAFLPERSWKESSEGKRTGRMSKQELALLMEAMNEYCSTHKIPLQSLAEAGHRTKGAWKEIGRVLPDRSLKSIYRTGVKKINSIVGRSGKWSAEEEEMLRQLVAEHGKKWTNIGKALSRSREAVRDKWKDLKDDAHTGVWTTGEEVRLVELVKQFGDPASAVNGVPTRRIVWSRIASEFPTQRTAEQLRQKWHYSLASKATGVVHDFIPATDRALVLEVYSAGAGEEDDVDWIAVSEAVGHPASKCKARWRQLCKRLPGEAGMSFEDKCQGLYGVYMGHAT